MKEGLTEISAQAELRALFSAASAPTPAQRQISERVLAIVHGFSCAAGAGTDVDHASLAAQFHKSGPPEQPMSFEHYVDLLEEKVVPHSIKMSSPQCMGHMTCGVPSFIRTLGDLVLALNQNLVKREASKALTLVERQTLAMIHQLTYGFSAPFYDDHVQNETSTLGIMTSGGTLANITALWIARNCCLGPADGFAGIEEAGVAAALEHYRYDDAVIIGSSLMHYSFEKAASILGFGVNNLLKLPVDRKGRLCVPDLRRTIADCRSRRRRVIAIVGIAGTTDCGSIDPLSEMADIAEEWQVHFHVDAAWGAPLLFSQRHKPKLAGIDRAHSVTLDGHKQFYLPIGNSMLLLRDPRMARVIEKQTRYMLQERTGDLGKCSIEGSRPGTILFLHAALHVIGRQGYAFITDESLRKARAMASLIRDRTELELLLEPETNVVLYRYIPRRLRLSGQPNHIFAPEENAHLNWFNETLQRAQSEAGRTFVSRTVVEHTPQGDGVPIVALRAVISNPLVEEEHVRCVLDDQAAIGARLESLGDPGHPVGATDAHA